LIVAKSGDVLDVGALGLRVELRRTAEDTGGEFLEFDVIGRARGFVAQEHVHVAQVERHEVLTGSMKLVIDGREHLLGPGEAMEVPAGTPHRQLPGDAPGEGRVRVTITPPASTQEFLERLATLSREGRINRFGLPKPVAGAELVRDFGADAHATKPPVPVQRALSGLVLGARSLASGAQREYVFVDEWDVAAPPEAVFDALADATTYPEWWKPVYIDVECDGPPAVGRVSRQHFKGRFPYHLRTRSQIVRLEPPRIVEGEVDGDLRGHGTWTLTPIPTGTHVRFDWRVHADRRLLRILTPVLRPALRWNHDWAIARAMEGLEPYAQRNAREATPAPAA
jgi:mannose-6-phosphate isomerase-like protein (cupin superfamily)/uncharacterized protein YndB with AHSA1/START domain